jgi:hypothetical protein
MNVEWKTEINYGKNMASLYYILANEVYGNSDASQS